MESPIKYDQNSVSLDTMLNMTPPKKLTADQGSTFLLCSS